MLRSVNSFIRIPFGAGQGMRVTLALALFVAFGATGVVDTYPRQWGIDALNYAFEVTFSDDTDRIEGETTVEDGEAVTVSYPGFWQDVEQLAGS